MSKEATKAEFEKAVAIVQGLPKDGPITPSQADQLFFYKYYKQATVGPVNTPRPGLLDFVGKAKWDAWKSVETATTEEAWTEYVNKLKEILKKVETDEAKEDLAELEAVESA